MFIMLRDVVLTFETVDKILTNVTNQIKATEHYFSVVSFMMLYHHFHYYATFLFKTPLNTLQYASVNHTLYGKCVTLLQLN